MLLFLPWLLLRPLNTFLNLLPIVFRKNYGVKSFLRVLLQTNFPYPVSTNLYTCSPCAMFITPSSSGRRGALLAFAAL